MLVDLSCARTQMFYDPVYYGQYVDPRDNYVWMIVDQAYLDLAYVRGNVLNMDMIRWEARHDPVTFDLFENASSPADVRLNVRYVGEQRMRYFAFIISLALLMSFCWLLRMADWRRAAEIDRQEREFNSQTERVGK